MCAQAHGRHAALKLRDCLFVAEEAFIGVFTEVNPARSVCRNGLWKALYVLRTLNIAVYLCVNYRMN